RPLKAIAGAAPAAEQVAGLVEYQHRRRGHAALRFGRVLLGRTLAWRERGRPVHDPDAVIAVGRDAGDLPQDPFIGRRFRQERIDLKLRPRSSAVGMRRVGDERHRGGEPHDHVFHIVLPSATRSLPSPSSARVARLPMDYPASTATTPGTALMAPAIWGETLKRPGSFTSTSVPSPSISPSATSPWSGAARPDAGPSSRLATLSIGVSSRRKTRSPLASLAAA